MAGLKHAKYWAKSEKCTTTLQLHQIVLKLNCFALATGNVSTRPRLCRYLSVVLNYSIVAS